VDTYVIDAGDGTDTIIDTDGHGTIVLDDIAISATRLDVSGSRASTDGRLDFTVDGDPAGESTLTIRAYAAGADHGGTPDNVIEVRHWHNGDLGITLGGGGPAPGDTGPQSQPGSDNSQTDIVARGSSGNDAAGTAESAGNGADTGGTWVDAPIVQAPESDAPALGAPTPAASFDVNAAIDQLLAPSSTGGSVLDPMRVQHAVAAFSGVLAPPDITASATPGIAAASGAITLADVADALAHDAGGQDFGHESAATLPRLVPDWYHIEEVAVPVDGGARAVEHGPMVARR
jgi:hypothetical protein